MANGVNIRVLRAEIAQQAKRKIAPRAEKRLEKEFLKLKRDLIREFNNDPITKELENGPTAKSKYVDTSMGGNLYSLIGFEAGTEPIETVRDVLESEIDLVGDSRVRMKGNTVMIDKRISMPTLATIEDAAADDTPEWANGRSWIGLLQRGIPWFSSYLYDKDGKPGSRSGTAIEAKKRGSDELQRVRAASFPGIPYINVMLAKFKEIIVKTRRR